MCASRAVPSGAVYRQLFDAQVQLSRSLLAGRKDTRTDCLSAVDSNTHCSTTSRLLCPLSSGEQPVDDDDDAGDVFRLPDTVVVDQPSSDIVERLTEKKSKKHKDALKQLDTELSELTQVCEARVKTISLELLSSLQEVDLRLGTLKDRMEQLERLDHVSLSLQEVYALWQEVEEEVKLKKVRIMELNHKVTESETQRTNKIRAVLRKYCHLLEKISFLCPSDVCRLIHSEATMLNQSLLANRRSVARLLLLLQEENLQRESLLRLHWEDCLSRWRSSRVNEVINRFRSLCSGDEDQQQVLVQKTLQEMNQTQQDLTEQRRDLIFKMCSLVPPSCSTGLVSDWFSQLTAVNQQIDSFHADVLHRLRCCYEQTWQHRLAEVKRCEEELSALQLSEEEVKDVVSSQLLTMVGRIQTEDEEHLAALDLCCDSVARGAISLSRCVFHVIRGAALLWETHSQRLEKREQELQQQLDDLRCSQQQHVQRKNVHLDDLLGGLRQGSSEAALKMSLDKTVRYLQEVKHSWRQCVTKQCQLLDRLPSLFLEETIAYSCSLSSFYCLNHTYRPSPDDLQNLLPSTTNPTDPETSKEAEIQKHEEMMENGPMSYTDLTQSSQDWLTEAGTSLMDLCDINSNVTFTSSKGVTYCGPAIKCPSPDLPNYLQQETHLSLFPVELVTHALSRMRTLFLDHVEQHFHEVLSSAVAMVTDRKEAVRSEQELQLQQLNPQHIQTHIYKPRLAELQLHRQRVNVHCEEVLDVLTSCRGELQELQASITRKNQQFTMTLSNMDDSILTADSSQRLEVVSSTLQDCLDQHIKDTRHCQTNFRQTVQTRLEGVRHKTAQLINSFRLFSEGGDFALQEVKLFQKRLKEETKQISLTEESIYSELEAFESKSLQQVKEVSGHFEEKLFFLKSEMKFMEKIQKIISSTQVQIKAEAASSNQQQSAISSRLEDLRVMLENTQVSPDRVCSFLSIVNEELRKRCQYLDFSLDLTPQESLSALPTSRREVQSAPPPGFLQPSRTGVDLLDDPVVGVIKSLHRFCTIQDVAVREEKGREAAGQTPVQHLQQRRAESVSTLSVKKCCRSTRTDGKFPPFGRKQAADRNTHSFSPTVNSVLCRANDALLLVAEEFYQSERVSRFLLVPDTLDQWTESMLQRLLGYQEQAQKFLSTSRQELVKQLCMLEELLPALPAILISNTERHKRAGLSDEVAGVRLKLEETLAASEKEKCSNVRQLRVSFTEEELQTLNSREELRQQQLHSSICSTHLELQKCVRGRGEEFVTSLASLTENLLHQLDNLLTPTETAVVFPHQHPQSITVAMETHAETGQKPCTITRTWSGIPYLSPPTNSSADLPSRVTTTITASITTTRCTLGHLAVIEQRDSAVKRFEQLFRSEFLLADKDKQRQLSELQSWTTHWRQQIDTLTHTHQH